MRRQRSMCNTVYMAFSPAFDQTDDFTAMASALVAIHAQNPEQFRTMGCRSRLSAEALDWRTVVQQLETLLLSIA